MKKRELEAVVEELREEVRRVEVEGEIRESAFRRELAKEQEGWASLDGATKRNRSWEDVERDLKDAYAAWCVNPLAKSYCDYMRYFVIGKGTAISAEDGDEPGTERISMFCDLNDWELMEKQICEELSRDGEVFVRFHVTNRNEMEAEVAAISLIDPLEITRIDCEEVNRPSRYYRQFTRLSKMGDDGTQTEQADAEWIPAAEIIHIKINTSHNELRGRSDLLVVLPWLKQLKRWIDDMSRRNYYTGAFAWDVECQGNITPAQVTAQYPKGPMPGSVIAHSPNEKWTVNAPDMKWSDSTNGARAIKLLIMAGYKMPESWYGDTGESNLATTTALAMPTLKAFTDRQDLLKIYFERIIAKGAKVEGAEVAFPELVTEEQEGKANAMQALSQALLNFQTAGLLSRKSAYEVLRLFVNELDEWEDDDSGPGEKKQIELEDQEDTLATAQGRRLEKQAGLLLPPVEAPGGAGVPPLQVPGAPAP